MKLPKIQTALKPIANLLQERPILAHQSVGNLLETSLTELIKSFDRQAIQACSDQSACNMLCSRVVGKNLRHPISGLVTLLSMRKLTSHSNTEK